MQYPSKRTHHCGELRADNIGQEVVLMGWVNSARNHGGVVFVNLRDREGVTQVVCDPERCPAETVATAEKVRYEFVVAVKGTVAPRIEGQVNPNMPTGEIEIIASDFKILNDSKPLPLQIHGDQEVSEETRLRYRYLDLRRPELQKNFLNRHRIYQLTRRFFDQEGFVEIETPVLTKSTPEGARDYLVPARTVPGHFFALPQSPQIFKQLLMISGFDKYFQIVKCYRDEDLRAHRQPEFTQIDVEMSFVDQEDVIAVNERYTQMIFKEMWNLDLKQPFARMTYQEAISRYGSDKPDTRFGLELHNLNQVLVECNFKVFAGTIASGGSVIGIRVPGGSSMSRKELDGLNDKVNLWGGKGLAWFKYTDKGLTGPAAKFLQDATKDNLITELSLVEGDLALMIADQTFTAQDLMGKLRVHLGQKLDLIESEALRVLWIIDFPLFEWDAEEQRYTSSHHPFTAPHDDDIDLLTTDPGKVRAKAYDLVINGVEVSGGSIRIHNRDVQAKIFEALKISKAEAEQKFGFLLEALQYGAPPHGGIAWGFDRFVMLMCRTESIREVIAFPKTTRATCPLTGAPTTIDNKQLGELGLKLVKPDEEQ